MKKIFISFIFFSLFFTEKNSEASEFPEGVEQYARQPASRSGTQGADRPTVSEAALLLNLSGSTHVSVDRPAERPLWERVRLMGEGILETSYGFFHVFHYKDEKGRCLYSLGSAINRYYQTPSYLIGPGMYPSFEHIERIVQGSYARNRRIDPVRSAAESAVAKVVSENRGPQSSVTTTLQRSQAAMASSSSSSSSSLVPTEGRLLGSKQKRSSTDITGEDNKSVKKPRVEETHSGAGKTSGSRPKRVHWDSRLGAPEDDEPSRYRSKTNDMEEDEENTLRPLPGAKRLTWAQRWDEKIKSGTYVPGTF